MVRIDLITGFLGSGKTTFIKEYARYLIEKGERICIIENDYGAVNIDMVMLQDLLGDNCNLEMIVGGDGKEAHRRRFRTKLISMGMSGYDRVLIEPSGIYDVDEFFDVLYDEPLDRWYEIGNVISLVDATAVSDLGDFERYIFMSEVACAGKLVFSKMSEDDDPVRILGTVNRIMEEFGGKSFDAAKDIVAKPLSDLTKADFDVLNSCGYRHASYVKLPIEDKQFTPLFYFDVKMPLDKLKEISKGLLADKRAGHVIRIKGFVQISDDAQTELNATEKEIKLSPIVSSRNVLIIIGEGLDKEYINSIFKDYCSVVSL
ncbi:GTP-binding protein [Butyrivibrio sp. XPD2006]|uniref:GTP-binding protein n=1 Tax=Butyrivibrio sp. XPD2006 TaxID=1280668 RepID=UPI0003B6917D|nr:GTP-binding protein [Butyrivibrio sp. XPD2006]